MSPRTVTFAGVHVPLAFEVAAARAVAGLSRLVGAGGGTTVPGKLLSTLDPGAVDRLAARLPAGTATISATMSRDRALRRFESSRVTRPTPPSTSVRTRLRALLVLDDGGRAAEEVLDVALVLVAGPAVADGLPEAAGPGEALDRAR